MYNLEETEKQLREIVLRLPSDLAVRYRWQELYSAFYEEWGIVDLNTVIGNKRAYFNKFQYIVTQPKMLGKLYLTALRIWQKPLSTSKINIKPVLVWDDFIELPNYDI